MKKIKLLFPIIFTLIVIGLFYSTKALAIKYYPVLMNFGFFIMFFVSAFQKETVIQKIAKKMDGELTPEIKRYTRNLTYIWAGVTFINFLLSFSTIFLSAKIWALYNGCISYCLIGLVFLIEYPIRLYFKRKWIVPRVQSAFAEQNTETRLTATIKKVGFKC